MPSLVWVDSDFDEHDDNYYETITKLRCFVNNVSTFNDIDQCVNFLTEINEENIFIIVSDALAQCLVNRIHGFPQLHSVYIFCRNHLKDDSWTKEWMKVKGIFTDIASICVSIKNAAKQCDQNSISISFLPASYDASNQNSDELDQSFMYTRIFKDILLEMKYDEKSIKDFATYCRDGNYGVLNSIDRFESQYHDKTPIWWYTFEAFLYSMLNRALRTVEIDTIIKMGFFVHDLHHHIEQLHQEQFTGQKKTPFTIYRGQNLSKVDFDKLTKSIGGLMSFNNFLSTSMNRDVSVLFIDNRQINHDLIGILFKITVDSSVSSAPFAVVDNVTAFDSENEILFSMHTVFRIENIEQIDYDNNRLWQVELKLTSDTDQQLNAITELIRQETHPGSSSWHQMGELLLFLGEPNRAEHVCRSALNKMPDNLDKAILYSMLGMIKCEQSKYAEALSFYDKAFEIHATRSTPNHLRLAALYNNRGTLFLHMGEYSKAFFSYEKSLKIYEDMFPSNHLDLATTHNNIGSAYESMEEYSNALSSYKKALEIRQSILPQHHPSLAVSYNNIGAMYQNMRETSKAYSFFEKSLEILERILPSNHPDLASSYNNIGTVYSDMGEYSKALAFYQKALEIRQKTLFSDHTNMATSYNNIATLHLAMGEYSQALSSFMKALEINEINFPSNHPNLANSYSNIGSLYKNMGEYTKALSFYEKALEIYQNTLIPNRYDLALSYNNIGSTYHQMGKYWQALSFYEKSLEINEKLLPSNHPDLAAVYNNIGSVYSSMEEYMKALSFHQKAFEIMENTLPPKHLSLAVSNNNMASIFYKMGNYCKAITYFEKDIEISERKLPSNHPDLAASYNNIGLTYSKIGEYEKAISFLKRAVDIGQSILSPSHPGIELWRRNLETVKNKLQINSYNENKSSL
ncbi:unnamed protein product [Rotaria magnacalcarata]|uniref:ADP ribosyltransferase domain-containing protein n=1 Tax=Rotaria magnacalcarata TaxID=392030 RepID=A0A815Y4V0_9BILA|nr:unnamed protein product [Rotaria magnacalcarata]CAF1667672.1 unnamed protein product [Rotaria magnacalcarata]CAF3919463.1 unnamed protein product [Rotaria magnacalcarata]CAF3925032.1 unnamed protein product [Rotaria magnacalcarata]